MDRKILIVILVVGAVLRLVWLDKSPGSVNWDEAALGYNAYSLWKTGADEYGTKWPLSLRSFDDYKPPLYAYLTAPIVGIFGLNEINTRLLSAMAGVASIGLLYLISAKLLGKRIGLIAAGMMAVEPWAIFYSRGAWEANLSLTLILATMCLILEGKYTLGLVIAGINVFAYHSAKIYLWPFLIWGRRSLGVILAIVLFGIAMSSGGWARWTSAGGSWREAGQKYFSYFSPANLFVRGTNEPNQRVDGFGLYYGWEIFFWGSGIWWLIKNWRKNKVLVAWLALAPLPAVITQSWFNPVRVLPLWAANTMLIAVGWVQLKTWLKWLIIPWAVISLGWFVLAALWQMPYNHYGDWQWGFKEVARIISPILDNYGHVVWETGQAQPYIFTLFYLKIPPEEYQKAPRQGYDFGKFEFRKIYWPDDQNLPNTLFIGGVYSLPEEATLGKTWDPQGYESARIQATPTRP
ncbi:MAG: glycosyltransferase family 39 protein [Patescibacteria group bacterium]